MNIRNRAGRLAMDEARAHEQADVIAILSRYIDRTLDREVRIQFNTLVFPKGGVLDVAAFGASCTSYHITASIHLTLMLLFFLSPHSNHYHPSPWAQMAWISVRVCWMTRAVAPSGPLPWAMTMMMMTTTMRRKMRKTKHGGGCWLLSMTIIRMTLLSSRPFCLGVWFSSVCCCP